MSGNNTPWLCNVWPSDCCQQ